ncbi:MAG: tetratricopeptide repeat protein [Epsilonproteobacteria bacterium]|nr:tetratricopeptide repeat protein [Campylobacterota bacterium]
MSLKENVQAIKEELTAEEQFLESAIKSERFLKKYKKPIIAIFSLLVIAFVSYNVYEYIKESNLKAANEAYLTLLKNPNDSKALETLKSKNPNLYMAFLFKEAVDKNSIEAFEKILNALKDPFLKNLALYQIAALKEDKKALENYALSEGAVLKDFAFLDEAYLLLKEGKIKEGKEKLKQIPLTSPLQGLVKNLNHYGVSKIESSNNQNKDTKEAPKSINFNIGN